MKLKATLSILVFQIWYFHTIINPNVSVSFKHIKDTNVCVNFPSACWKQGRKIHFLKNRTFEFLMFCLFLCAKQPSFFWTLMNQNHIWFLILQRFGLKPAWQTLGSSGKGGTDRWTDRQMIGQTDVDEVPLVKWKEQKWKDDGLLAICTIPYGGLLTQSLDQLKITISIALHQ